MSEAPELLTPAEVAKRLGKSTRWVHDAAAADRIGHVRIGRTLRFTVADLTEYVTAQHRDRTIGQQQRADESWGRVTRRTPRRTA